MGIQIRIGIDNHPSFGWISFRMAKNKTLYLRNLMVRDNSGAKTRQLIGSRPKTLSKYGNLTPISRVISSTKREPQVRKGVELGKVAKRIVVNTRAPMKGWNGIVRWNQKTTVVVVKNGTQLLGNRIQTKLPKSLFGKGRTLRSTLERRNG